MKNTKGKPKRGNYKKKSYKKKSPTYSVPTKQLVKVEKKRFNLTYSLQDSTMGQVAGNSYGYFAQDITPTPPIGTGVDDRIGSLINVTSLYLTLQMRQMSACQSPVQLVFYLIYSRGYNDSTPADVTQNLFNTNNYIGAGNQIWDYGSDINVDHLGAYRILKKFYVTMKPDSLANQQMPISRNIGLKFRKSLTVRYKGDLTTQITLGRMFLIAFASNGNASTGTTSTLSNVPVTAPLTGQYINFNIKYYYTDL